MYILMIAVFVIGYAAIAFEHSLKIDKAAAALITGVLCWAIYVLGGGAGDHGGEGELLHHLSEISSILFFLLGAMTIVEVVDAHEGFSVITDRIKTNKIVTLMWIICWLTFFFSAILDNLTTSIVMISLLKKLVDDKPTRWIFAGMVIIAANAGGAFSPIGDVTTTMLWIGGQVSTGSIITHVFFPSIIALLVPLLIISTQLKGEVTRPVAQGNDRLKLPKSEQTTVFTIGVLGLLFVPVFKTVTHLPPFMGMMLSLGVLWIITDLIHKHKPSDVKQQIGVLGVLRKIDMATLLDNNLGTDTQGGIYAVASVIGLLSSIVDNVPLVAASMGMYPLAEGAGYFSQDGLFWQFLAYCAGTGGSVLIIGSAAGVAVMGLERIPFGWYLKRISLLALIGYVSGIGAYIFQNWLIG